MLHAMAVAAALFVALRFAPVASLLLLLVATPSLCAYFHYQAKVLIFEGLRQREPLQGRGKWGIAWQSFQTMSLVLIGAIGFGQAGGYILVGGVERLFGAAGTILYASCYALSIISTIFLGVLVAWPVTHFKPRPSRLPRHQLYILARWRLFLAALVVAWLGTLLVVIAYVSMLRQIADI